MSGIEVVAISGLIVAVIGAVGHFVKESNMKKIKCCCAESDCMEKNKLATPIKKQPKPTLEDVMKILAKLDIPPTIAEQKEPLDLETSI